MAYDQNTDTDGGENLKSALSAAWDATVEPAEASSDDDAPAKTRQHAERDDAGKFAHRQTESEPDATKREGAPKPEVTTHDDPAGKAESNDKTNTSAKVIEPPANWSEADKAMFKGVPPNAQEFLLRRHAAMEADYTRKTQSVANLKRDFEPVQQLFTPHLAVMAEKGFTPASLITAWYNVEKALIEGRGVSIVRDLVKGYKLDPSEVARAIGYVATQQANGAPPAPAVNPTQLPPDVQARLDRYEAFMSDQQRAEQARQQAAYQQQASQVMQSIENFRSAKGQDGSALHPHFDEVEDDMTTLIHAARVRGAEVPTLEQVYEQAVWANPSTRSKLQESARSAETARIAALAEKERQEARAKAEKAKNASSSVRGAPGQSSASRSRSGERSLRDELAAAFEDAA